MVFPKPPQELLSRVAAITHAQKLLRAEGIHAMPGKAGGVFRDTLQMM